MVMAQLLAGQRSAVYLCSLLGYDQKSKQVKTVRTEEGLLMDFRSSLTQKWSIYKRAQQLCKSVFYCGGRY